MCPTETVQNHKPGASLPELVAVMKRLLGPDGCPWDREQTLDSLRPYLIEETYEVLDAIERGTAADHRDELGDLLMHIVFHAELRAAAGEFDIDDVVRSIVEKLIRRHPHVFGDAAAETSAKVLTQWNRIKQEERREKADADPEASSGAQPAPSALDGVPIAMPALARAEQLTKRAAHVGFDWPDVGSCREKLTEELAELDEAIAEGAPAAIEAELGDLLFAAVNLARKLGCDAEGALRNTVGRFVDRFGFIEQELGKRGLSMGEASLEEMDALWDRAKQRGS